MGHGIHYSWLRHGILHHLMSAMYSAKELSGLCGVTRESASRSVGALLERGYVQKVGRLYVITVEGIAEYERLGKLQAAQEAVLYAEKQRRDLQKQAFGLL